MVHVLLESAALAPRDPSLDASPDEWPEFDLTNVSVHVPDREETMASLLLATDRYPLTVRGQLEPSHDNVHLLLQQTARKRIKLEIPNVKSFSYGQYQNGTIALWAAGSSGWYSIRPGRSYRSIFQEMTDAVNVFYFVVDAYREPRKTGRGRHITTLPPYSAQELFEKYATDVLEEPSELGEAADKIYQHKDFILSSMIAGKEGIAWSQNPLFLHLSRRFSAEYAGIRKRLYGMKTRSPEVQKPSRHESAEESSTAGATRKRKRGKAAVADSKNPDLSEPDGISKTDTGEGGKVEETPEELPRARQPEAPVNTGRRTRKNNYPEVPAEPSVPSPESDVIDNGASKKTQAHRKRKSLLRLRPSTASKSASRSGKAPVAEADPQDDEVPASSPEDRRTSSADATSRRTSKRHSGSAHEDEGIDMADSHSEEEPTVLEDSSEIVEHQDELEKLSLRTADHRSDPVQEHDTWVCALDGCRHKIHAASTSESQAMIREHYVSHAYDDDERVQLVKRLQAPSLPVSHLMERVRQQAKVEGFPGSRVAGTRYPNTVPPVGVVQRN